MSGIQKNVIKVVERILKYPMVQNVCISTRNSDGYARIVSSWSQVSPDTSEGVKFEREFTLNSDDSVDRHSPYYSGNVRSFHAPSLKRKVLFRPKKNDDSSDFLLDLWSEDRFEASVDLSAAKLHGAPYLSGDLASFQWNADESQFLFMAERKRPTAVSFFDRWSAEDAERGAESRWYEDWGEQMEGQHESVVVVVDVASASLRVIGSDDPSVTLGQAVWLGDTVYACAWTSAPKRLGLVYCDSRPSRLVSAAATAAVFSPVPAAGNSPRSCRSLRVSPHTRHLLYLERDVFGPHHAASRLVRFCPDVGELVVLVDLVDVPSESDPFPGIYSLALPKQCFLSDSELCFSTQQGTRWASYCVNIASGERRRLTDIDFQILAAADGVVCGVRSSALSPHQLMVWRSGRSVALTDRPTDVIGCATHQIHRPASPEQFVDIPFTSILLTPSVSDAPYPLVVFPHGGPHSVFVDEWSVHAATLVSLGAAVLLVNYRGSTGAGHRSLMTLPGRVGSLDVADVQFALQHALSAAGQLDSDRVAAFGGSHGGFLALHLSSRLPQLVRAVVARNPVCDIASMAAASDIPDWCFFESGGGGDDYTPAQTPTGAQLATMLSCSPLATVHLVRAPTLLLVGRADRRVVPSQALVYHQALLGRGVSTELRLYNDCHPLYKPAVIPDVLVHGALWLIKHLDFTPNIQSDS